MAEPRTVREDANTLNSEQIAAILPHRYPFALVDRILDYVPNTGRAQAMTYALSNSLGFGGHNACIALRRWEG